MKLDYRYIVPALKWLWRSRPRLRMPDRDFRRIYWHILTWKIRKQDAEESTIISGIEDIKVPEVEKRMKPNSAKP